LGRPPRRIDSADDARRYSSAGFSFAATAATLAVMAGSLVVLAP